jgi:flagellar hook-associated protein 2
MATSISNSGSVSSAGIGSGLDVNAIITGLMRVERAPLTKLQSQATAIQTTISAFGAVQSATSTFRDAVAKLALPSTWSATAGSSANPAAVTVQTSSSAAAANYAVRVTALAASQSTVSPGFASADALVGAGTLHIDTGAWNGGQTAFTAKAGAAGVDIAVAATDTLATLAGKINAAGAGVSASVVNDASGARLVYSASTTGTDNAFRITALDADGGNTDAAGLSKLAFDPASGTIATTQTQAATNAAATINGLAVSSPTNTLTNVLDGLSLGLVATTAAPVQITVAQDNAAIKTSVQSFVDAYNALSSLLSTDLKYDNASKTAGPLQADSTAVSLQRQLRALIGGASTASSTFSTLSQVGLEAQTDGTLKLDATKFSNALADPVSLKKFFSNVDTAQPANNGIGVSLRGFANSVIGAGGLVTARVAGLNGQVTRNQKDQSALGDRINKTQARLTKQYTALDAQMASLNALGTYVSQQITNWNKGNG